ncbi:MAG: hypothetical protein CMG07_03710 [Candidatus Marinimicrobia bacterium]|nr:hypothetical protein [Candidatus Neomarinimicrobiota bacterium]|tara:strand:+ start:3042 stop:3986 length:945 start_codon:yes stop_codon:yes gene_type:complete
MLIRLLIFLKIVFLGCAIEQPYESNSLTDEENINFDLPTLGSDQTLDIMTWNIENFPKTNMTSFYLESIINSINIDLIALQEITDQNEFNNLVSNLDGNWLGFRSENTLYGELAYLINQDNLILTQNPYMLTSSYFNDLSSSDFEYIFSYRAPFVLNINFQNKDYVIINIHYKCCGDGILENEISYDEEFRRFQSSKYLKKFIDEEFNDESVIILGDFNDNINDDIDNNIFIEFINDDNNYYFADTDIANGSTSNWSFPTWPSHLDHILITNELFNFYNNDMIFTFKIDNYVGWNFYETYISDHRPVIIKISGY